VQTADPHQKRQFSDDEENSSNIISPMGHLFCISIIGILLKQLRLIESVGIFEIACLFAALNFILTNRIPNRPSDIYFEQFMLVLMVTFLGGSLISLSFFPDDFSLRDSSATVYTTIIVIGWTRFREGTLVGRIALLRDYLGIYCAIIVFTAIVFFPLFHRLWYFDTYFGRLMGLSDNPNQLASLAVGGVVFSALLLYEKRNLSRRDIAATTAIFVAGLLSQSVAFVASILIAALAAVMFQVLITGKESRLRSQFGIAVGLFSAMAVIVLAFNASGVANAIDYLYEGGSGKGIVRLEYWIRAITESINSPLLGFGPGGHVRVDSTSVLQEVHNIFIELLLSGGILSLIAYLLLLAGIIIPAVRLRLPLILFSAIALIILGSFHTVLRHTYYWIAFYSIICALAIAPKSRPTTTPVVHETIS
jgi:hypothetical protein